MKNITQDYKVNLNNKKFYKIVFLYPFIELNKIASYNIHYKQIRVLSKDISVSKTINYW